MLEDTSKNHAMVIEFDGEKWSDKLELNDYGDTFLSAAVAVDLSTSGYEEFCNWGASINNLVQRKFGYCLSEYIGNLSGIIIIGISFAFEYFQI